jgi:nitrate reductase NapAB chaperone NapD
MPVKSYLAHTDPAGLAEAASRIAALPGCTALPAENRGALIIVTDTNSEDADRELHAALEKIGPLRSLTLVAAFAAEDDLISLGGPKQ